MTETTPAKIGIQSDINSGICPECGKEHVPNAVTIAAMQEADDIMSGKKKVEWNRFQPGTTKAEAKEELKIVLGS